jgi:hypothetical protein
MAVQLYLIMLNWPLESSSPKLFWSFAIGSTYLEIHVRKAKTILKAMAMCLVSVSAAAIWAQAGQTAKPTGIAAQLLGGEKYGLQFGPYKWQVLEVSGKRALMITEDIVEKRDFDSTSSEWELSNIRFYLNRSFLRNFSVSEQMLIYGTAEKIFLLNIAEANRYFPDNASRSVGHWWWLRSPGGDSKNAAYVNSDGTIGIYGGSVSLTGGVRPALWINL